MLAEANSNNPVSPSFDQSLLTQANLSRALKQITTENAHTSSDGFTSLRALLIGLDDVQQRTFDSIQLQSQCEVLHTLYSMLCRPDLRMSGNSALLVLDVMHGLCLLNYRSKQAAGADHVMQVLIGYVSIHNVPLAIAALETLQATLVDSCKNIQAFEQNKHLNKICSILQSSATPFPIRHKCIELLTIYLSSEKRAPDAPAPSRDSYPLQSQRQLEKCNRLETLLGKRFVARLLTGA
ncbi:cell division control protein 14, SIN component-domain-containing protein [Powellomyces hirtus]|nr:cell division control protein 14, SIN component-domain-containing protein [Powellomyces hirtus]